MSDADLAPRSPPIRRRWNLTLDLGADDYTELLRELRRFVDEIEIEHSDEPGAGWNSACGGCSSGYSALFRFDPTMTHDRYFELIEQRLRPKKEPT